MARGTAPLDDHSDGVGRSLRQMRNLRRQQENIALPDVNITFLAILYDAQRDIAFKLIEQFLGGIDVRVLPLIRSSHDHDNEI